MPAQNPEYEIQKHDVGGTMIAVYVWRDVWDGFHAASPGGFGADSKKEAAIDLAIRRWVRDGKRAAGPVYIHHSWKRVESV